MEIIVSQAQGKVPVTILHTQGDIDHASYRMLIDKAAEACSAGARHMLLDLGGTKYMSSSGLVALQSIIRMLRGEGAVDLEAGWQAIRGLSSGHGQSQESLKLTNVQPPVAKVIDMAGLAEYFPAYPDEQSALDSF
jgi:anti-anti-sigma factor